MLHKVNLKQVKKSEIVQSFLLADEETKFYVDKLQKKTNYPKFSQSTDKIKIKPSALFSTIKYHLDEDNKSKGSSGNIQPPQPPAVPAKYYPAMKFGHIELDKGTIFSGSFTINGGIVI